MVVEVLFRILDVKAAEWRAWVWECASWLRQKDAGEM